jgi:hypothetical protein
MTIRAHTITDHTRTKQSECYRQVNDTLNKIKLIFENCRLNYWDVELSKENVMLQSVLYIYIYNMGNKLLYKEVLKNSLMGGVWSETLRKGSILCELKLQI